MIDLSAVREVTKAKESGIQKPEATEQNDNIDDESIPKGTFIYEIEGPLFFGTIQKFEQATIFTGEKYKVLILRMQDTIYLDAGGIHVLEQLYESCCKKGIKLLVSEIHTQPYVLALKSGLTDKLGKDNFCGSFVESINRAKELSSEE